MTLTSPHDLDLNTICHLDKWHQPIDLAEIMCLGQRTPKKRLHTCALVRKLRFSFYQMAAVLGLWVTMMS